MKSLGHLALENPNLEQIATEFIFVWLVSIYRQVSQKKTKEIYMGEHVKILTSQPPIPLQIEVMMGPGMWRCTYIFTKCVLCFSSLAMTRNKAHV